MNSENTKDFDKNFNDACELIDKEHTNKELLEFLKNGSIVEKHYAALYLSHIDSENDARILVSNLTGQDGKIREAVSTKINQFLSNTETKKYFEISENYSSFLDAIVDINGNICRNIISGISNLKTNPAFCKFFLPKLELIIFELIQKVKQFKENQGYKVNKEAFKLYWALETISVFAKQANPKTLEKIISEAKDIKEYTIREKCAKILSNDIHTPELDKFKQELKEDKNYYVRKHLS